MLFCTPLKCRGPVYGEPCRHPSELPLGGRIEFDMNDSSTTELLPAELLARLERLQVGTRRRLVGGLTGEHRSPRFGASLDFSDYREYHPGDDIRRIDMNAYARFDRLLLKLFEAEDDVEVRLLIDTSGSMEGTKLLRAKQLAAAIGFVALTNRDIVTVHTFPARANAWPRLLGRGGVPELFDRLASLEADGSTPFAAAAMNLLTKPGPPGLTIVLSDLLTPEWDGGIRRLPARQGDMAVVHILDPSDITPAVSGDVQLVDAETGATVDVSVSPAVAEDYTALATAWLDEVAGRVRRSRAGYTQVFTTDDLEQTIIGALTGQRNDQGVLK